MIISRLILTRQTDIKRVFLLLMKQKKKQKEIKEKQKNRNILCAEDFENVLCKPGKQ